MAQWRYNMLSIQKKYLEYLGNVKKELEGGCLPKESIDQLFNGISNTELLVPVIGAFSAGKSSLINSFLQLEYLPVGITPETSLAAELRYSEKEYIEAIRSDNSFIEFSIDEMRSIKDRAREFKFIKIYLNNASLREIFPLVLVDMPGFDSPLDLHNQAILNYINKGVYYIVLASVEDGSITRSVIRQLSDIKEFGRDFSFILSKINLRSASEVNEISGKIKLQLSEQFDHSGEILSIGIEGGNNLKKIISAIDPEKLFENIFIDELKNNYHSLMDTLNIAISVLKKDKTENEDAILDLKKGIEKIIQKRDRMFEEAHGKYSETNVSKIVESVGRELSNSADELVNAAISGHQEALSQSLTSIVRHQLINNIKSTMGEISSEIINDFAVELKGIDSVVSGLSMDDKWLEKVTQTTKLIFEKTTSVLRDFGSKQLNKDSSTKIYKSIATVLAVTTNVLAPILEVILIFLPDILAYIFEERQKKKQAEQIRNHLLTSVIPSIKRELREKLPAIITNQITNLINDISVEFEKVLEEKKLVIANVEKEKAFNIEMLTSQISKYVSIKEHLTSLAKNILFV